MSRGLEHRQQQAQQRAAFRSDVLAQYTATLLAAATIYVGAAIFGYVSRRPLVLVASPIAIMAGFLLWTSTPGVIRYWSLVRPLYRHWSIARTRKEKRAQYLYQRFNWGLYLAFGAFMLFLAAAI